VPERSVPHQPFPQQLVVKRQFAAGGGTRPNVRQKARPLRSPEGLLSMDTQPPVLFITATVCRAALTRPEVSG
jgi:hypothetical protein